MYAANYDLLKDQVGFVLPLHISARKALDSLRNIHGVRNFNNKPGIFYNKNE